MRPFTVERPDLFRVALVRDLTDEMRQMPAMQQAGHGKRRELAARIVDAALERQSEGQER